MNAPELPPGAIVGGRYRIRALLGYGGTSASYHADAPVGPVALKIYSPAFGKRQDMIAAQERFHAGVNSLPTDLVVPISDFGFDQTSSAPFSVTELVRMTSLAALIAQRPLAPEEVTNLITSLARAVDAAHVRQIAHHALKPTNVFVGPSPFIAVRIMDFGASLARSVAPSAEGYELSAPWMAPEQIQAGAPAGAQADIFSTALLAFYALTGRSYWLSCQGPRPDIAQWQREIVSPPAPVSQRGYNVGFPVPPSLDAAFAGALATNPAHRYRTIGEFAAALGSALSPRAGGREATLALPASAFEAPMGMGPPSLDAYPPPPTQGYPPSIAVPVAVPPPKRDTLSPSREPLAAPAALERPTSPPARPSGGKTATLLVAGIAILLVLVGAAAVVLFGRGKNTDNSPVSIGVSSSPATASAPTTSDPKPTTLATAASPTASTAPASTASAATASSTVEVRIVCDPACTTVKVDDKPVSDPTAPLSLAPGKHRIAGSKEGYYENHVDVDVQLGPAITKELKLFSSKGAGGSGAPTAAAPSKPCGKFLKKCK